MKQVIQGQIKPLVCSVFFVILAGLAGVFVQFLKGGLLDSALAGNGADSLRFGLSLLSLIAIEMAAYYGYDFCRGRFSVANTQTMRRLYFERLLGRTPAELLTAKQGELVAEYTNQIDLVNDSYLDNIPMLIEITSKAVIVSVSLFILDARVAVLTLFLLTMPLYIPKLIEKKLQSSRQSSIDSVQKHLGHIVEWISGFELIKNYSIERIILDKFRKSNDDVAQKQFAFRKMTYLSKTVTALLSYMSHFIVLAFAGWLVLKGDFSAGDFFVAIGMIDQLSYPIIAVSVLLQELISTKPTVKKAAEWFRRQPVVEEKTVEFQDVGTVAFDHVDFAYDPQAPVLEDLTLDARSGEKCLIMGASGSGKSTSMNLLMDYYKPGKGKVAINGVEVGRIKNLNQIIAVMRQDAVLFHDTLRNNLTMYREMPDEKLTEMLERLNLSRFACTAGLDSIITEGGTNLSGGERKRIALARTLLRNAPITIIDEPLANVDMDTAAKVEDVIVALKGGVVFVISHQFDESKKAAFAKQVML